MENTLFGRLNKFIVNFLKLIGSIRLTTYCDKKRR